VKAAYLLAASLLALVTRLRGSRRRCHPSGDRYGHRTRPYGHWHEVRPPVTPTEEEAPTRTNKPAVAERKTLPDVIGMNLQEAQDTLQAAGFYLISDRDATGRGRFQVFDRNWVVTQQKPAGGRKVPIDTLIVLYAKKYGE